MGCINSTPHEDLSLKNEVVSNGPVVTVKEEAAPRPQPLFTGQETPAPAAPSPPTPSPAGGDPSVKKRKDVRRDRSNLSRRGDALNDDEDSDWDQYSTANFDPEHQEPKDKADAATHEQVDASHRAASFVEKAAHKATTTGVPLNYKETSILRIDKVKGCMFVNQYLVVKFLGRGACGKVFLCLNTHDLRLYAMKVVRKVDLESSQAQQSASNGKKPPRNPMEDLKREIMIMKKMKHNNIVTLTEVIDDPSGSKLLLVMEYMDGGPVLTREALEKKERVPESLARQYFRDMIKALDYLHSHKVVHGDLKPENVLMAASGEVKLADFGCSKVFATGNEYLERCNGTPAFLAPEMMKPNTRYRGRPTDVYALGACLYTLMFGRIPFSAPNLYKLFQVVQVEPVRYPMEVPISDSLKNLLGAMLIKNPRERIGLADMMKHPWVTMDGAFPLKSFREQKNGETNEQHDMLPDGRSFAECNPQPDLLSGLSRLGSHERTFNKGDIIMKQGDNGMYLLYIVSGTADVLVKWAQPPKRRPSQANIPGGHKSAHMSQDEFMDESETMNPITDPESRDNRMKLLRASTKARDIIKKLREAAAGGGPPNRDLLIAQRGPGDLLGDMALFCKSGQRCATVRCATPLSVRVILQDQLNKYLSQHPMAKLQLREDSLKKESEITMVEALMKLANSHEVIAASLDPGYHASGSQVSGSGAILPSGSSIAAVSMALPSTAERVEPPP